MHSVLFVASIPPKDQLGWGQFMGAIEGQLKTATNVARLAENVWLVDCQQSPSPLGWLIALADRQKVSYGLLPFERAPEWLPGGFDPKTIQGRIGL